MKTDRHFATRAAITLLAMMLAMTAAVAQTEYFAWGTAEGADGSEEHPYVITTTDGLNLLASEVNNGTRFGGKYFVLSADIKYTHIGWNDDGSTPNNFTRIGTSLGGFKGHFDGQGHTISGIRIHSTDSFRGLFGSNEGTVWNVVLADAHITGQYNVGGIAGKNTGTVENCSVAADVFIGSAGDSPQNHGGIVGWNQGTVRGCTSSATLEETKYSGGIVGQNSGTVSYCRAVGVTVNGDSYVGAIVGDNGGALSHNYYYNCTRNGNNTNIGIGNDGDITENDGAVYSETIPLLDGYSNAPFINAAAGGDGLGVVKKFDCKLEGRTLYKDGSWNTICLPFVVRGEDIDSYLESPASIMTLKETAFADDGTLTLTFEEINKFVGMQAGKPYIIKWNEANSNLVDPQFSNRILVTTTNPTETDYVDFIGITSPLDLKANDRFVLYLGSDNSLYYPSVNMQIGSFRAYFKLKNGLTAGDPENGIKALQLNFGDETSLTPNPSPQGEGSWYDLSGRKLEGKPTQKGIYINNGKKMMKK